MGKLHKLTVFVLFISTFISVNSAADDRVFKLETSLNPDALLTNLEGGVRVAKNWSVGALIESGVIKPVSNTSLDYTAFGLDINLYANGFGHSGWHVGFQAGILSLEASDETRSAELDTTFRSVTPAYSWVFNSGLTINAGLRLAVLSQDTIEYSDGTEEGISRAGLLLQIGYVF